MTPHERAVLDIVRDELTDAKRLISFPGGGDPATVMSSLHDALDALADLVQAILERESGVTRAGPFAPHEPSSCVWEDVWKGLHGGYQRCVYCNAVRPRSEGT